MTEIPGGYKGFWCFENYWQSGKVYEGIPLEKSRKWWLDLKEPRRKYPPGKGKRVLYSMFDGVKRDYIESRKEVYVPEYTAITEGKATLEKWRDMLDNGTSITVYDFDGPRADDGTPMCEEVSASYLRKMINDARHPFGHGYIVSALLLGIKPERYAD